MSIIKTLAKVKISNLLNVGAHFGHNKSRWNPKMKPYIYDTVNNIHIIDLRKTVPLIKKAMVKLYETIKNNGRVLFIGSKIQATDLILTHAEKCGQFYINHRWLGGTLTNWNTINKSITKLDNIEKILEQEKKVSTLTKKETLIIERQKYKLLKSLQGIRKINDLPNLIIIIDTNREHLAIKEAIKKQIPIIAILDTNSNPDNIDYPIPANDDSIKAINMYCNLFSETALLGIEDSENHKQKNDIQKETDK